MPVINTNPTKTDQLVAQANGYRGRLNRTYNEINRLAAEMAAFVWKNPAGFTPQQVFDAFGKDAGDLVKVSDAFRALILTYTGKAVTLTPSGFTAVVNADGTVTVRSA
jgi:exosome complex RNA-binding protein Csl4